MYTYHARRVTEDKASCSSSLTHGDATRVLLCLGAERVEGRPSTGSRKSSSSRGRERKSEFPLPRRRRRGSRLLASEEKRPGAATVGCCARAVAVYQSYAHFLHKAETGRERAPQTSWRTKDTQTHTTYALTCNKGKDCTVRTRCVCKGKQCGFHDFVLRAQGSIRSAEVSLVTASSSFHSAQISL